MFSHVICNTTPHLSNKKISPDTALIDEWLRGCVHELDEWSKLEDVHTTKIKQAPKPHA